MTLLDSRPQSEHSLLGLPPTTFGPAASSAVADDEDHGLAWEAERLFALILMAMVLGALVAAVGIVLTV